MSQRLPPARMASVSFTFEATRSADDFVRIDMHDCPSKGFLLRNGLRQHPDYCDHCIGWIGPLMKDAGYVIHHEHNHCGQCWWDFRRAENASPPSAPGELAGADVRLLKNWRINAEEPDRFLHATGMEDKETPKISGSDPS